MCEENDGDGKNVVPLPIAQLCPILLDEEAGCRRVNDVDEEIFLLYTLTAPPVDRRGLGQVDDRSDALSITVDARDANVEPIVEKAEEATIEQQVDDRMHKRKGKRQTRSSVRYAEATTRPEEKVRVTIKQDSTSLRSSNGDTGSVVWRSSVYLAAKFVQDASVQASFQRRVDPGRVFHSILHVEALYHARVVELGAGTGILPAIVLSHSAFRRSSTDALQWLATDQEAMLPLLRRNVEACRSTNGANVRATALDWIEASQCYRTGSESAKAALLKGLFQHFTFYEDHASRCTADLVIATDCIFNPHLFASFLDTLTLCTTPGHTVALVACELRQADMLHDFLRAWHDHDGGWCIRTVEHKDALGPFLAHGFIVWLAWRRCKV